MMQDPNLLRTIQAQQSEINYLKEQLGKSHGSNFQHKYMKALKQISTIVNANKQFKQELIKLRQERGQQSNNYSQIQNQELNKAYQKILRDKNEILGEKQDLELENEKLKYTIAELEENVAKLNNQLITMAQQKESFRMMSPSSNKSKNSKDRESQIKRNMENYEEHHATLSKNIRKLEDQNRSLQSKLSDIQSENTKNLSNKEIQFRQLKFNLKEEYETQINELRVEIRKLMSHNSQLTAKVQGYSSEEEKVNQGQNQYEKQLMQTLREVKAQMEPMRSHITELQDKNQQEKQQTERENANLQIKVIELDSEIQRLKEIQKFFQNKQIQESGKTKKMEDAEKTIRKLQEENRMLGGKIIVLQSKEVALRNRNGDQLQQRVLQFQNRVQMLLSDKETIANMKNVGIHQLIALKAYILELDSKIKQVVNENEYAVKKYRTYKEKCSQLIKQLKQHDIAINALKGKLSGYDRLVMKLQGQFERAISINDSQIKSLNVKISEQSAISIEVYKKRYDSLVQKLTLQQKYSEQELQTLKLNYETQIVELSLKLEDLNSIKETIGLYKEKNEELSVKLNEKQNELLDAKINKTPVVDIQHHKVSNKETIQRLNQTISSKQTLILNLENQIRKVESEWKSKYNQIQQMTSATISKKSNQEQEKQFEIQRLEQQIRSYRTKLSDMESTIFKLENRDSEPKGQIEFKQYQSMASKKSELEIDIEQLRSKYEIELTKVTKLNKQINDFKRINQQLETEATRLRFQIQNIEKELQMELSQKNNEIRRLKAKTSSESQYVLQQQRIDGTETIKISSLKMQIETLQTQIQFLEKQKERYYSKTIQLQKKLLEVNDQLQRNKNQISKLKTVNSDQMNAINQQKQLGAEKMQYTVKMLKQKIRLIESKEEQNEDQMRKIKLDGVRQKDRLTNEINYKEDEYNKLMKQFSRLKNQFNSQQDVSINSVNEFEFKVSRLVSQINGYKDQIDTNSQRIQRYETQIRRYREREDQYQQTMSNWQNKYNDVLRTQDNKRSDLQEIIEQLQNKINKQMQDLEFFRQRQEENQQAFASRQNYATKLGNRINQLQNREGQLQSQLYKRTGEITKLNSQLNLINNQLEILQESVKSKDNQIARFNSQLTETRNQIMQTQYKISGKDTTISRLNSEISYLKDQVQSLQNQADELKKQINKWKNQHNWSEEQSASTRIQLQQKDSIISRLNSEISYLKDQLQSSQNQIEDLKKEASKWKNQHTWNQQQSSNIRLQLQEKDLAIIRIQNDIKSKSAYIDELTDEIQMKTTKISELQSQIIRVRAESSDYENQTMEKISQISRINFELTSLKKRYNQLEQTFEEKQIEWQGMNRQLNLIRSSVEQYEQDVSIKESIIERSKNDLRDLKEQIETLNNQLFNKNKEINILNQEAFRLKMESQQDYNSRVYKLQSEIHHFKAKVTNLETQLEEKQFEVNKAEIQIRNVRSNIQINKYSDEEYQILQTQYFQMQSSLNKINREVSDHEIQISQRTSKIQYLQKLNKDLKKTYEQDREYMENQIQAILGRERKLKITIDNIENDSILNRNSSKEDLEQKQFGMHLYQTEVDRLNKINQQLTEEIDGLKLKLTGMTNQEERIVQNLTIMTMTFAEVQALRDRMKNKDNEISQVRKSLIQIAGSSKQDISLNSRTNFQYHHEEIKGSKYVDNQINSEYFSSPHQDYTSINNTPKATYSRGHTSIDNPHKVDYQRDTEIQYEKQHTSQANEGGQFQTQLHGFGNTNTYQSRDSQNMFTNKGVHSQEAEGFKKNWQILEEDKQIHNEIRKQSEDPNSLDAQQSNSQNSNQFNQLLKEQEEDERIKNQAEAEESYQIQRNQPAFVQPIQPVIVQPIQPPQIFQPVQQSINRPGNININFAGPSSSSASLNSSFNKTSFQQGSSIQSSGVRQFPGQMTQISIHNPAPGAPNMGGYRPMPQMHQTQPILQQHSMSIPPPQGRPTFNFGPGVPQQPNFYAK